MFAHLRQKQEELADVEERLLSSDSTSEDGTYRPHRPDQPERRRLNPLSYPLTLLNILVMSASFVFMTIGLGRAATLRMTVNDALRRISTPSPVFDHVDFRLLPTSMNGSVLRTLNTPWNSGPEDEEKEAMWNDLQHIRAIPITGEQIRRMGKDPAKCAKLEDSVFQKGDDLYIGSLDIFHQVHCLNRLRKEALNGAELVVGARREHTLHCVDMLMQHLLCTANTGFYTYNWYTDMKWPQPDFSVKRQCKDWRQLVEYRDAYAVDQGVFEAYEKPHGVYENHRGDI